MVDIPVKTLSNGFSMPVYGLGLWQMGGRWTSDSSQDAEDIAAIRRAIDLGITHIDTAESYGDGHAEELLSRALEGVDRSKLFIVSKVSGHNQSPENLRTAAEASLQRMKLDSMDLYLLHRFPDSGTDITETMKALDKLVDDGLVKNIGVSNFSVNRFKAAQALTSNKLVCNQVHYNVQYREVEKHGVVDFCQQNDVLLSAWRPVQKGMLPESELLVELAAKYGKTPMQIAINWLISQQNVITLSKTSSAAHLDENLGALGWSLDSEDIERIRSEFPDQKFRSDAVPLDYPADIPA